MSSVIYGLRAEYQRSHLGIGIPTPRLSWKVRLPAGTALSQIEAELTRSGSRKKEWASLDPVDQVLVAWPFPPLRSRERAVVRIRGLIDDEWSEFSLPLQIEAGLLGKDDWSAYLISPQHIGALRSPAPALGRVVGLEAAPTKARLYVTAHGLYEFTINGTRVSDDILSPGWTSYEKRLRYSTYDVTHLLAEGENLLLAVLGNGWFRGALTEQRVSGIYGTRLGLLAQLELELPDGSQRTIATDETWRAGDSAVLADDLYDGTTIDFRRAEMCLDDLSDSVEIVELPEATQLVASEGPPIRETARIAPRRIWQSSTGTTLVDFGQNLVGWVRIGLSASAQRQEAIIAVRHAEVLSDGELALRPLRKAEATDRYRVELGSAQVVQPVFTFHGFQYAEIEGVDPQRIDMLEAVVVGSDLNEIGQFTCSSSEVNQLHANTVWSARGNFLDIPTDCPQRDERLGWTGDAQVFAPTAHFLFQVDGFFSSWLRDLAADQGDDGAVPFVVPDVFKAGGNWAAAWGDAAVVVPYTQYQRCGDLEILRRQYDSARAWVDGSVARAGESLIWSSGHQFGDWLDPSSPPDDPSASATPPALVATACLARCADLMARIARITDQLTDHARYSHLFDRIRSAFIDAFGAGPGLLSVDSQTAYAMALCWDLIPANDRAIAGRRLADIVTEGGYHVGTGFVGTPLVLDALSETGHSDVAYSMLMTKTCPSWLYPVTMGATTIWERWDSMLPDGSVNTGQMTSFNHYAYGAVSDWLHRRIGGIAPTGPGYRRIVIAPHVSGPITNASTLHDSPYGVIAVDWQRTDAQLSMSIHIPFGIEARLSLPGMETRQFHHGHHQLELDLASRKEVLS